MDLFDAATNPVPDASGAGGRADLFAHAPLAVRMRPANLDEVVGQQHLLTPGSPLRRLVAEREPGSPAGPASVVLWGPPGTGKTTLAYLVARASDRRFVELSAVTAGVKDVRAVVEEARRHLATGGAETVLFVDEVHRFSRTQQDALLPSVENRWVTLIAATTENPSFTVVSPLLSRSLLLTLQPLEDDDIVAVLNRAVGDERGLAGKVELTPEALDHLVRMASGDARRALTVLEAAAGTVLEAVHEELAADDGEAADGLSENAPDSDEPGDDEPDEDDPDSGEAAEEDPAAITVADVERAADVAAVRYDRAGDQHYDVASALIKSIRGSDVDATLHYLARMIAAGEDPRFIARRLVISASEDIGMADPSALQTAVAAMQAVSFIGMPEARIVLSQAAVHLALAPKSNAAYIAIDAALADVRAGKAGAVPAHLRDTHYSGAKKLGHGQDYKYAHSYPHGIASQQYLPDELVGAEYYEPTDRGFERDLSARIERVRKILRGE